MKYSIQKWNEGLDEGGGGEQKLICIEEKMKYRIAMEVSIENCRFYWSNVENEIERSGVEKSIKAE